VSEQQIRLEHLIASHKHTRELTIKSRELLISVCGTDGSNGKLSVLFESRDSQGKRIGALEKELSDRSARLMVAEGELSEAKKELKEVQKITHKLELKVAAMAATIAAVMQLGKYLLDKL
jgi:chromosome segregation ATPase